MSDIQKTIAQYVLRSAGTANHLSDYTVTCFIGMIESGEARCLITKPTVAGFGLNWQHCDHQVFAGLSYSFEQYYQAVRRCWRFGQRNPVNVDIVLADSESGIQSVIANKETDHQLMQSGMAEAMRDATMKEIGLDKGKVIYTPSVQLNVPSFLGGNHE